ncbi:MAG: PQQ-dependent sugar dehydrogenase, partial [Adhaeribacter sp.]
AELPDPTRFQKTELAANLNEPMELQVLPDGNVLFIERGGSLKLFDRQVNKVRELATLPVFKDLEDGLLGLALDPDFATNRFIYLYYSPVGGPPRQRVSRFELQPASLDLNSEKILLEIPTQRTECCHSAGSLAFGPDRNLYIAIGDNTNPHNPGYYNSIDEGKGRAYWDAQRTAANTNDLRGKVLRIKPEPDGSYSIPEGNLFPKNTPKTRPEIYAMGLRNPYRISVDPKTGWLYWGDVGQNTIDDPARGPISYDEWHQAQKPGFFGWPYFAGDNKAYADFDFETGKTGPFFDPQKPVNNSPNNTGLRELPPAVGALIWYSYEESEEFKNLGSGGKSPIAGPFYHADQYKQQPAWVKQKRRFPDYYDGKWFIAEWIRDWINVVTLDEKGKLVNIERFMPGATFDHPIDLEFGPDGALYVLEYGPAWFSQHQKARLVRIDYIEGNRPPVAHIQVSKTAGAVPLELTFSAAKSFDKDKGDKLQYEWQLVGQNQEARPGPETKYLFSRPGAYLVQLKVTDNHGGSTTKEIRIEAGNERPEVAIHITGNKTFYWPQQPVSYQVEVNDKEDGSLAGGQIAPQQVLVTADLADMGTDLTLVAQDQEQSAAMYLHPGQQFISQSDCLSCHQEKTRSAGPSWLEVAERYQGKAGAVEALTQKVIRGGSGNWGQVSMSAHPQLKKEVVAEMVKYILDTGKKQKAANSIPAKGTFTPEAKAEGLYVFRALYKDKGAGKMPPLVGQASQVLRNAKVWARNCDEMKGAIRFDNAYIRFPKEKSHILFRDIDLSGIRNMNLAYASPFPVRLSFRTGNPGGAEIGSVELGPSPAAKGSSINWKQAALRLKPQPGKQTVYVVATGFPAGHDGKTFLSLDWIHFLP